MTKFRIHGKKAYSEIRRVCSSLASLKLLFGIACFGMYFHFRTQQNLQSPTNFLDAHANDETMGKKFAWPGSPHEQLGHPLVAKGESYLSTVKSWFEVENSDMLNEFLSLYEQRPDKINLCGIRINHALAIFIAIKYLKPSAIIESGVNAGVSTYIMRRAGGNDVKIFSIDPLDKPICGQSSRWIDNNENTEYFTGSKFKDFSQTDWISILKNKKIDPSDVLVYFDDHLNIFDRFPTLMKNGLRHVMLEDNYKAGEGATPGDKAGFTPKQMFARIDEDSKFAYNQMISYFEFPPLVPPIMAKLYPGSKKKLGGFLHASDSAHLNSIMEPLLRPDQNNSDGIKDQKIYNKICDQLGIDPELKDDSSYMQIMNYCFIAYFELQPLAPHLVKSGLSF